MSGVDRGRLAELRTPRPDEREACAASAHVGGSTVAEPAAYLTLEEAQAALLTAG